MIPLLVAHVEGRTGEHARTQLLVAVGNGHLDGEGTRRSVERRIDQRHLAREHFAGKNIGADLDRHPQLHGGIILLLNVGDDLQRIDLHDVQHRRPREQVARFVVARRHDARNGRTHLDVLFQVVEHLLLHVERSLGLFELLRRDAAGLIDRNQPVVVVERSLVLQPLLVVLRRIERHEQLPRLHARTHVDQNPVDMHARNRRGNIVLLIRLDLGGIDLVLFDHPKRGGHRLRQHFLVGGRRFGLFLARAGCSHSRRNQHHQNSFHTSLSVIFLFSTFEPSVSAYLPADDPIVVGLRGEGSRRSPANNSNAPAYG